tara:strand:- start:227 stop:550 length:324 start_codon:yes stop_codon:yes gene_type:complete
MADHDKEQPCPQCGAVNKKAITAPNFILKGDGWTGKNMRVANQMREKNKKLDARQNEMKRDAPNVSLAPNVDGERVNSWADAQKLAKSKGKNADSYDSLVHKESKEK